MATGLNTKDTMMEMDTIFVLEEWWLLCLADFFHLAIKTPGVLSRAFVHRTVKGRANTPLS